MHHDAQNIKEFNVENTEETFATWINKPFIPNELKSELSNANLLIIPREGFGDIDDPLFPTGTEEILTIFKEASDKVRRVGFYPTTLASS